MKSEADNTVMDKKQAVTQGEVVSLESSTNNNPRHSKKPAVNRQFCIKILQRFLYRFLRGFANGVFLHLGIKLVAALSRTPFRKSVTSIWKSIFTKDSARLTLFCALYPSIYHLLLELLNFLQKAQNDWIFAISGGFAGLSLAVLETSTRQTLAFFTVSRALGAGVSTLARKGFIPSVPFFDVGVFCACGSLLAYFGVMAPRYMNQAYYRSVLKWLRDYTDENLHRLFREPGPRFLTCQECGVHAASCLRHWMTDFVYSLADFVKIYLPLHLIPVIVFKRRALVDKPTHVLTSLCKNTAVSTLFLTALISLGKGTMCLLRNVWARPPPGPAYVPTTAGAVCGLAVLLERPSRRKELVLFILHQAVQVLYNFAKGSHLGPRLWMPRGFTLMFALSMASMMHAHEREPESLSTLMNSALRYFIGPKSGSSWDASQAELINQ